MKGMFSHYICYRFIVHFPIRLDLLFITFFLHFCLLWTFSLSISSSPISDSTLFNHVLLGLPTSLPPSTLNSIHFFIQPTTSDDSCDILNSNQISQFYISFSVFHGNTTHLSNHLHLYSFKLAYTRLFISSGGALDVINDKSFWNFIHPFLILAVAARSAPPYPSRVCICIYIKFQLL